MRRATLAGAVLSALAASTCCIGPLLLALLGVGSAGALVKLEPYRPYFTALAVAALAMGFYFSYRKKKSPTDDCRCEAPAHRGPRILLWLSTVVVAALIAMPYLLSTTAVELPPAHPAGPQGEQSKRVKITVQGMTCASCAAGIKSSLEEIEGVQAAMVSYEEGQATVQFTPSKVSAERIEGAIKALGYKTGK